MSLYLVYVCDLIRISVVDALGFESHFSLGFLYQFYSTNTFFWRVRPLESQCVLLYMPTTIPTIDYILYRMVVDSNFHRIYGIVESIVHAQLWFLVFGF